MSSPAKKPRVAAAAEAPAAATIAAAPPAEPKRLPLANMESSELVSVPHFWKMPADARAAAPWLDASPWAELRKRGAANLSLAMGLSKPKPAAPAPVAAEVASDVGSGSPGSGSPGSGSGEPEAAPARKKRVQRPPRYYRHFMVRAYTSAFGGAFLVFRWPLLSVKDVAAHNALGGTQLPNGGDSRPGNLRASPRAEVWHVASNTRFLAPKSVTPERALDLWLEAGARGALRRGARFARVGSREVRTVPWRALPISPVPEAMAEAVQQAAAALRVLPEGTEAPRPYELPEPEHVRSLGRDVLASYIEDLEAFLNEARDLYDNGDSDDEEGEGEDEE